MRRTVSVAATKLVQWREASLLTSRFSTAKIIASWRTGLGFRRRIRFTCAENVSCDQDCSVRRPQRIHEWAAKISAEDSGHYSRTATGTVALQSAQRSVISK